jgi:hypothetical protein
MQRAWIIDDDDDLLRVKAASQTLCAEPELSKVVTW